MKIFHIFFVLMLFGTIDIEKSFSESLPINEECNKMNNTKNLHCIEDFRTQSLKVFSVVDSTVGIFEDPNTKLTIIDLGTFYGIGGNGTIPDTIQVYRDDVLWKTTTKETGIAPSTSHSEWQLPQTFFYNELPGRYKLVLITNNTETLIFEFLVKQISSNIEDRINDFSRYYEDSTFSLLPPLKQIALGIPSTEILCKEHFQLIFKLKNNLPVCVLPETAEKLIERGWANTR